MRNKYILGLAMLLNIATSAQTAADNTDNMFPNAVISRENYDKVKTDLKNKPSTAFPVSWYERHIKGPADKIISDNLAIQTAKSIDDNPNSVDINKEMQNIHILCLAYAFTQDNVYLNKAVEYLKAWAAVNVALANRNIHEGSSDIAVEGYSIIRKVIST